jgi:4-hydroxy-4-methyl-2-oxoglutarate aldolase
MTLIDASVRSSLAWLGTATLHEAARGAGALPAGIHSVTPGLLLIGRALTVAGPPGDNLWIHRAVEMAAPGDVLVIDVDRHYEAGYWGEILSTAGKARQLAGVVIDGCVRDSARLASVGVPVFARGFCMRSTTKLASGVGQVGQPLEWGDVTVRSGDVVVGDGDGVLVLEAETLDEVISLAYERVAKEESIVTAIGEGASTIALYHLPRVG